MIVLIREAIWSWWLTSVAVSESEVLWLGSVDRYGVNKVRRIDTTTLAVDEVQLDGPTGIDDHNGVALGVAPGKPILAFYSRHQNDTHVRMQAIDRETLVPGSQQQLEMGGNVSYAQVLTREDVVYLFARVNQRLWRYRISADWGQTWDEARTVIDGSAIGQNYLNVRLEAGNPWKVRLFHYGHPNNSSYRNVGYARLHLGSGAIHGLSGNPLGNLSDPGGPALLPQQLDVAISPSTGFTVRMLDVGTLEGMPSVAYAVWKPDDPSYVPNYKIKRWSGATWDTVPWSLDSGIPFGHSYYGGVAIGDSGQVWTSREANGQWIIERHQYSGGTVGFMSELARASTKLIRPYAVRGSGTVDMVYQDVLCYEKYTRFCGDAVVQL